MWAKDWKNTSYWLDGQPALSGISQTIIPDVDVLVVGSGYTGLHAAIQILRGGRKVMIIDAGAPGFGCSTRNGGQISTSIKPSQAKLARKFGTRRATAIRQEGETALDWIEDFITSEKIL